ncbi:MAG: hypothetical protein ABH881_04510 [bacterium]
MFNIIHFILIIASLCVVIVIVVRKFSLLASLNIESIQAEREAKFKERIISNKIKRNLLKYFSKFSRVVKPVAGIFFLFLKNLYGKLVNFHNEGKGMSVEGGNQSVDELFAAAEDFVKKEDFKNAEESYIKIIEKDSRCVEAFLGLGKLYFESKSYNEAKQTVEHTLKLIENEYGGDGNILKNDRNQEEDACAINISEIYFDLALINKAQEDYENFCKNINKALKIEPNNPRYLDIKLEMSIIKKDKYLAQETYEKFQKANPDNQKLAEIKKEIDEL